MAVVLLNDGSGHFTDVSETHSPRTANPKMVWFRKVMFVDLDRDGDLDCVQAALTGGDKKLEDAKYFTNDGKGRFTDATTKLNLPFGDRADVAVLDADGDGYPDLLFLNQFLTSDLQLNDRKGGFVPAKAGAFPLYAGTHQRALTGDFDRDGDDDVIVVTYDTIPNPYLLNDGKGNFSLNAKLTYPLGNEPSTAGAVADLDGDGDLDVVIGNARDDNVNRPDRILWNDGKGNFTVTDLPGLIDGFGLGRSTLTIHLGDLDDDGDVDIILGYVGGNQTVPTTRIFENLDKGRFQLIAAAGFVDAHTRYQNLADFDQDGDLDLFMTKSFGLISPARTWINVSRQLHFREQPVLGKTLALDVYSARARQGVVVYVGLQGTQIPVGSWGTWWIQPQTMAFVGLASFPLQGGKQTISLPIPNLPALAGLDLHAQALYVDYQTQAVRLSTLMREQIAKP
ncbi:MAG: VCBS repeat-containing protein [Planctomycetota bacterium]